METTIAVYNGKQTAANKAICDVLAKVIDRTMPYAESKIWHGAPVWFIDGNPITGYSVLKASVQLLFWSGQSFDEPELQVEGKFKAAQIRYTNEDQIDVVNLERWVRKAEQIQWDYKNIVKRRGELLRLK